MAYAAMRIARRINIWSEPRIMSITRLSINIIIPAQNNATASYIVLNDEGTMIIMVLVSTREREEKKYYT
jgi:hypothetical protein